MFEQSLNIIFPWQIKSIICLGVKKHSDLCEYRNYTSPALVRELQKTMPATLLNTDLGLIFFTYLRKFFL